MHHLLVLSIVLKNRFSCSSALSSNLILGMNFIRQEDLVFIYISDYIWEKSIERNRIIYAIVEVFSLLYLKSDVQIMKKYIDINHE